MFFFLLNYSEVLSNQNLFLSSVALLHLLSSLVVVIRASAAKAAAAVKAFQNNFN
jgi:hypothetical protein